MEVREDTPNVVRADAASELSSASEISREIRAASAMSNWVPALHAQTRAIGASAGGFC